MPKDKKQYKDPDQLGWDDAIEEGEGFVVLPEGPASFEVLKLDRARKEMGKLGTCNVGVAKLLITHTESGETATKDVNLPLHRKVQFKLYQFFTAIGQRKHGDEGPFVPNWAKVVGGTGLCELSHRTWAGKDGKEHLDFDVEKFLEPGGADSLPNDDVEDQFQF